MKARFIKNIILSITIIIVIFGLYKYIHRYDTNLEEVFNENERLDLVIDDDFVSNSLQNISQAKIAQNFKKFNEERRDISYGENVKTEIVTYGDNDNIFRFAISNDKKRSFPIYAKITSEEILLNDIQIGESYESLKNKFHIQDNKIHNFRVTPLDGGLFFEFYFDEEGELKEVVFKDTYIH